MNREIKLHSKSAILDVQRGRVGLLKHLEKGGRCFVKIQGVIDVEHGGDDGVSREFCVKVNNVEAQLYTPHKETEE